MAGVFIWGCLNPDGARDQWIPLKTTSVGEIIVDSAQKATTPVIYNIAITDGNTEYSQALPSNTKKFMIHTRDGTAFRVAFVTGKVATPTEPYFSVPASQTYYEDYIEVAALTLYFAAGVAGKTAEIIAWS